MRPLRLENYRIDTRIGSGGMGDVFRAFDQENGRWVALKAIRADSAGDHERRRRFRREASAVARLDHPSIVKLFELLETENGEILVMELVEGETLALRLQRSPLPADRAMEIARDIAAGLAEAHRNGIIHRDLKAENIMIAPDGRAKILDFGLAKGLLTDTESQLTADGVLMGTTRAMSPEQARGHVLDPRSDLFSLGSLLYEMATSVSPFAGGNSLQTLKRICTYRQPSARDLRPDLPEALSDFIDHLLEKNPDHRPRNANEVLSRLDQILAGQPPGERSPTDLEHSSAFETTFYEGLDPEAIAARTASAEVDTGDMTQVEEPPLEPLPAMDISPPEAEVLPPAVAAARPSWHLETLVGLGVLGALLLAAWGFLGSPRTAKDSALYLAIPHPTVEGAKGREIAALASAIHLATIRDLYQRQGLFLIPEAALEGLTGSPAEIARAVAADEVLETRVACESTSCRVQLQRIRGHDGERIWTQDLTVPPGAFRSLDSAVRNQLDRAFDEAPHRPGASFDPSLPGQAFERLVGLQAERREARSLQDQTRLLRRLQTLRRRWPGLLETPLLEAEVARQAYRESGEAKHLDQALAVLDHAERLSPGDPRIAALRFQLAFDGDRLGLAESSLEALQEAEGNTVRAQQHRAQLLEHRGQPRRALELLRRAVERRPGWHNLYELAAMEWRQGEIEAARRHGRQALDLAPDLAEIRKLMALLESRPGSGGSRPKSSSDEEPL